MITDQMIKTEFIHNVVSAGLKKIRTIQKDVISKNLNVVSGDLLKSLEKAPLEIEGASKQTYYLSVLPYMRFLDIHYRENMGVRRNLAIYNRSIWGVIYGETQHILRYGLSEDLRKSLAAQLEQNSDINLDNLYQSLETYKSWPSIYQKTK